MQSPTVSIITPTTANRELFNKRIASIAQSQTYPHVIEHLFDYSDDTIDNKRNNLCREAKGDIIVHMDSDDVYAPDWVSMSVAHLLESKSDLTGLDTVYFYMPLVKAWLWRNSAKMPYVAGATLCYWRKTWERKPFRNPFKNVNSGEDTDFCVNRGKLIPHNFTVGFLATIHGDNTACHNAIGSREMQEIEYGSLPAYLRDIKYEHPAHLQII